MNTSAKYIIFENSDGHEFAVLFHYITPHSDIRVRALPIRARFFRITAEDSKIDVECWGESTTLSIKSDPEKDVNIVRQALLLGNAWVSVKSP